MIALNLFLFVAIFTYVNHNYINKNNIDELLNIALKNDKLLLEKNIQTQLTNYIQIVF